MSETLASLRHKISSAGDLKTVVRSMKALAAASIGQYESSVVALSSYEKAVELGLTVCFRNRETPTDESPKSSQNSSLVSAIVFGSDQGLVGQFNDRLAEFVIKSLALLPGEKKVWAVGDRIRSRLADSSLTSAGLFTVPTSVNGITPLVGQILVKSEGQASLGRMTELYVFHNRPLTRATYEPVSQHLLPLDRAWSLKLAHTPWPAGNLPQVQGDRQQTLEAFIREYLFVSLFKACAESLAAENGSRLAAMQRAEKSIDDQLESLNQTFHRLRQSSIDEELFDVVSGYESLSAKKQS